MKRNELIQKLKNNFNIKELVCAHCYNKFGESAWQFLSTELLSTLYTLRYTVFNKPITVNNWYNGGSFSQRGLRCNMCQMVKDKKTVYISAHCLGCAIDFNVEGLTSDKVNQIIKDNIDKFEYPIRLETNTSGWSHVDTYQPYQSEANLIEFKG